VLRSALLLALLALAALPGAATARVRLAGPDRADLDDVPATAIRDTVIHGGAARGAGADVPFGAYGGVYTTATGDRVRVYMSTGFVPDARVLQNWADFFGSLVHGPELARLTVYLTPVAEMQGICSAEADGCYSDGRDEMIVPGQATSDGVSPEAIAAHEYGHHIANHRNNAPWPAVDWGPKYWATNQGVCDAVRSGWAAPGNEEGRYGRNPGEAWAETNLVLNGGTWGGIVDPDWFPRASDLYWARQDILHPYEPGWFAGARGHLTRHHARSRFYRLAVENDGRITVELRGTRSLDADLYLTTRGGRRLARATRTGHREVLRYTACGERTVRLEVYRYHGFGRYRFRAFLPYDAKGVGAAARRSPRRAGPGGGSGRDVPKVHRLPSRSRAL
jgi:hypothetical protein